VLKRLYKLVSLLFLFLTMVCGCMLTANSQEVPHAVKGSVLDGVALPGEMWSVTGFLSPVEKGNIQSENYFEQRAVIFATWHNSITLTPYAGLGLGFDRSGYSWNNKIQPCVGFKVNKRVRFGVLSAGTAYAQENRFRNADGFKAASGRIDFISDWFGWNDASEKENRFPGSTWAIIGHYSPVEQGNLIERGYITQGFVLKRFGTKALIPYGDLTVAHDSKGFDWENLARLGGGVKLSLPYTEIGAGYVHETRFNSGVRVDGIKVFINCSHSWNWFGRRY